MVEFASDYWHTLDKNELKPKEFGVSSKMGDVVQNLKADITAGASHVELGFMGAGKEFGGGNKTPESFGSVQREEIRQMAKINKVSVSTHASLKLSGMTGLDREQRGFSDRLAENNLTEMKRTIDFAGEACGGGPVVVHTDEFPREVSRHKGFEIPGGDIEREEIVSLVDRSTGQLVRFQKGQNIHMPKDWIKKDGHYVDFDGKPIGDFDFIHRVPKPNKDGKYDFEVVNFNKVKGWVDEYNHKNPNKVQKSAEKEFFLLIEKSKLEQAAPFAHNYATNYNRTMAEIKEFEGEIQQWKQAEKGAKDMDFLNNLFDKEFARAFAQSGFQKKKGETPSQSLGRFIQDKKAYAQAEKEGYIGYQKQIEQTKHLQSNIEDLEKFGVDRSAQYMAKAAMYALQKKEQLQRQGYKDTKDIFIAPENVFPEGGYGSHPDELKRIVKESRDKMITYLTKKEIGGRHNPYYRGNVSEKEAADIAADHIKATFDIGHAYTWKKFFKGKKGNTPEQNKAEFEEWLMKKVDELNKDKIIGHVHLSDNMGYFDEHLTPGHGEVPIEKFVDKMKKAGHKDKFVVEWGAQSEQDSYGAMLGAWANIARSPVYRIDGIQQSWSDIENVGYFGRSSSPNFITGQYGPSKDKDWNLWGWSEAPLE